MLLEELVEFACGSGVQSRSTSGDIKADGYTKLLRESLRIASILRV